MQSAPWNIEQIGRLVGLGGRSPVSGEIGKGKELISVNPTLTLATVDIRLGRGGEKHLESRTARLRDGSNSDRKVPSLRFILRDGTRNEVYAWTVESSVRPLRPREITNFTTRVASAPADAAAIQIRFARIDEIGSNADP